MNIAQKLKKTRTLLGLSQSTAAERWGISIKTLQAWEQKYRAPRGLALAHLEMILEKACVQAPRAKTARPASRAGKPRQQSAKGNPT